MDQTAFLNDVLKGNIHAVQLISCLGAISQIWDDLIDKDKFVSNEQIHKMMWDALVYLPENKFYRQYFDQLQPLIRSVINDYYTSTQFEHSANPTERTVAFVLRDSMCNIIESCAYILGGYAHMREVTPLIRKWVHNEDVHEYLEKAGG